ncbi:MAG: ACT domain-containing protein [Deltaproteobacteria bacterium]|nr:MAG: ACT domain-containing protein [Deltaproteobacteria bacterium]
MNTVHHLAAGREPDAPLLDALREAHAAGARVLLVVDGEGGAAGPAVHAIAQVLAGAGLTAKVRAEVRVETTAGGTEALPLHGLAERRLLHELGPGEGAGIDVLPGGAGRAPDGSASSLGEGGGLLTACLVASALGARDVHHWTTGTTLRAADPDIVPEAPALTALHVREAAELSFYGGPLPPMRAMQPAAAADIPIVLHTRGAETRIDHAVAPGAFPVRAVAAVRNLALVRLEGTGLSRSPDMQARLFAALAAAEADTLLISQGSAERSVTFAVRQDQVAAVEAGLKAAFRIDLSHGDVEDLHVRQDVAVVAAVGLGMAASPGVAGRAFTALGEAGANVLAIAQGSSEVNISLAASHDHADRAVRALCAAFGLDGHGGRP